MLSFEQYALTDTASTRFGPEPEGTSHSSSCRSEYILWISMSMEGKNRTTPDHGIRCSTEIAGNGVRNELRFVFYIN